MQIAIRLIRRSTRNARFSSTYYDRPKDLESYRKQLIYRSSNLGMLELDLIIGTWAKENIPNLSEEECEKYSTQVIAKETPDLYKLVIGIDKKNFKIEEYDEYVRKLREYAESNDKVLRKK